MTNVKQLVTIPTTTVHVSTCGVLCPHYEHSSDICKAHRQKTTPAYVFKDVVCKILNFDNRWAFLSFYVGVSCIKVSIWSYKPLLLTDPISRT